MTPVTEINSIARTFVAARRAARALPNFPGTPPIALDSAYAAQDAAIALWPARIAGWKVGRITDEHATRLGADRLIGPIFADAVWPANASAVDFPVFAGGFAAVEAEYVITIGGDAPEGKADFTAATAAELAGEMRIGIEAAGSPLATINELGPTVVVSDFGNNAGLILGAAIPDWHARPVDSLTCSTWINGAKVGSGGAASLPGGPLAALAFALNVAARRGMPLKRGQLVSTGATTGIHDIVAGDRARVEFDGFGAIECAAYPAKPI